MDLFDVVKGLGGLSGGAGGSGGQAALLNAVVNLLSGQGGQGIPGGPGLPGAAGGLGGLVQAFQRQGLGDIIGSWVSTGQNLPISPDQLHKVLGSGQLSQFAAQAGVAPEAAGSTLASLLPTIVDRLTPDGQLPPGGQVPNLDLLSKLLK